ncbi:MAG: hypothetical protein RJA22_2454 [Verrucomicrobiota bacterium]|jgi:hypothetical protein
MFFFFMRRVPSGGRIPRASCDHWRASLLCWLVLALLPAARGDVLYLNTAERADPERFAESGFEFGEEIVLAGEGTHVVTNFLHEFFGYGSDFTANQVEMALRFYGNDGLNGMPGSLLYDSGFFHIPATGPAGSVISHAGLQVAVPRSFTWTVTFRGLSSSLVGLQSGGLDLYRFPTVGQTYDDYWERSGPAGAWVLRAPAPGQPAINFGCEVQGTFTGAPTITRPPQEQSGRLGQAATFEVVALGTAPLTYQWQREGTNLPGATAATLLLTNLAFTDAASYRVIVANGLGSVTSAPVRLRVELPLLYDNTSERATPERFAQSGHELGEEIILAGNGTSHVVTNFLYEFFGHGPDFTNGNVSIALRFYANDGPGGVPGTLLYDSGYYPIPATGPSGSVISYAGLSVSVPRSFTWAVQFQGLTSGAGGLQAAGLDLYRIPSIGQTYDDYWERSAPGGTWELRAPAPGQPAINFGCQVAGLYEGAPVFTVMPEDRQALVGRSATLSAYALGSAPLAYQWRKDGNPISGATNGHLTLVNLGLGDSGVYSVRASNPQGTALSPGATLTVLASDAEPPVAHCPAAIIVATPGGGCASNVTFTATVSDNLPEATIACVPASGSSFAKGTTTVVCTATDTSGNTNACSFTVTVNDVEPPAIGPCPPNLAVGTTVVTYAVPGATDTCAPAPTVACVPPSGSSFPAGATVVMCTATDAAGNTNACTFTVTVTPVPPPGLPALVRLDFNENGGVYAANGGTLGGSLVRSVPIPAWTVNAPPGFGSALDYGTTPGNYGVDSVGVLTGLGNLLRFTITGWVNNRSSSTGSGGNRVVRWFTSGGHGVDLVYRSDGSLDLGINAFPNSSARSSSGRIPTSSSAAAGNWRFFAVTYDATLARDQVRYYFGSPTANATFDRAVSVTAGPVGPNVGILTIGAVNPPARLGSMDRMFRGLIDQVAIFDTVLSPADLVTVQRDRPVVNVVAIDAAAAEPGTDTGTFRLTRSGATAAPLTVSLLWNGTAVNGVDYQARPASAVIPAGSSFVDLTIVPTDDAFYDPETVTLSLVASSAYGIGIPSTATVVLSDNDVLIQPVPLVHLRLNENAGTATANAGSLGGVFNRTTPVPAWTPNTPPGVGGASAVDFGTTVGNYGIDSPGALAGLGNLPRFTITGWLNNRSASTGSGGNRIARNYVSGAHGIDLVYRNDGSLDLGVNAFPNSAARSSAGRIPASSTAAAGNWRFFAVTYDSTLPSGQVRYYFGSATADAALDVTRTYAAGAVGPNVGALSFGHVNLPARTGAQDRMFRGLLDEVAVFGAALTAPEIVARQRGTTPLPRLLPDNPGSLLQPVAGLAIEVDYGLARLRWPAQAGQLYQVEFRDGLEGRGWEILAPEHPAEGAMGTLEDKVAGWPGRFYRVLRLGLP